MRGVESFRSPFMTNRRDGTSVRPMATWSACASGADRWFCNELVSWDGTSSRPIYMLVNHK